MRPFLTSGCGRFSPTHLRTMEASELFDAIGVAGIVEEAARSREAAFAVRRWETDYRVLVEDPGVEAVVVTTPALLRALQAGKHVLCEKPMARSVADGKAMVDAERGSGSSCRWDTSYAIHPTP